MPHVPGHERTARRGPRGERVTAGDQNTTQARETLRKAKEAGGRGAAAARSGLRTGSAAAARLAGRGLFGLAKRAPIPAAGIAAVSEGGRAIADPAAAAQAGGFAPPGGTTEAEDFARVNAADPGATVLGGGSISDTPGPNPRALQESLSAVAGVGRRAVGLPGGPEGEAAGLAEAAQASAPPTQRGLRGNVAPADPSANFARSSSGRQINFQPGQPEQEQRQGLRREAAPADTLDRAATESERRLADIFGEQARGGGLASAFALPNLAGNILRREAGGRISRQEEREAVLDREADTAQAGLRGRASERTNQLASQKFKTETLRNIRSDLDAARESGDDDRIAQAESRVVADAIDNGPGSAEFQAGSQIIGAEVQAAASDRGLIRRFIDEFSAGDDAGFISSVVDAGARALSSGDPEQELAPESGLFLDSRTGNILKRADDGGPSQIQIEFDDLSDQSKQFFRSFGISGQLEEKRRGELQGARRGGLRRDPVTGQ